MATTGRIDGEVSRCSRIALGLSVGATVLMVGAIAATQPDIVPTFERTRSYIGDSRRPGALGIGGSAPG